MKFIQKHWFGMLIGFMVLVFCILFILVMLSPRQDMQKRGFIPCTEAMAEQLLSCENKVFCSLSAIIQNSWCDMKVVGRGVRDWAKGQQATPWENYIYTPEFPTDEFFDEQARAAYLSKTPDIEAEMQRLHELNKELEDAEYKEPEITPEQQPQELPKDGSAGMGSE